MTAAAHGTPRLIERGDLLAALDRASAQQVTIISAPAGSGKTSLLRAWAGRPGQRHRLAVLHVRRDQHDAQDFWLTLLNAVRQASGTASGAEPPTNLSRLEIASELSVSLNTVSTHIRSIYAKFGVRDRSSAVQRAREFRLLAAGRTR